MKQFWLVLAAVLGLAATSVPASADLLFTLNDKGSAFLSGAPFGTVNLHQVGSGSTAYVTVTVQLAAGNKFAGTGAGYAIAWDIKSSSGCSGAACYPGTALSAVTVNAALTPDNTRFSVQSFASGTPAYKASPFTGGSCGAGSDCFEYAIDYDSSGSSAPADTKLVFDVKKTGGLVLTDFIPNTLTGGWFFTADIFHDGRTGNVGAGDPGVTVPEPQTWLLFFAGLLGLTLLQRRRKLTRAG